MSRDPVHILVVDDDRVDVKAIMREFSQSDAAQPIRTARDGLEALQILRGDAGEAPLPRPNLILLDLRMPRMGGLEFLEAVRSDPALRDSVVFVMTTSSSREDKARAYGFNVAGYMVKSCMPGAMQMLSAYLATNEFP